MNRYTTRRLCGVSAILALAQSIDELLTSQLLPPPPRQFLDFTARK